MPLGRRDRRCPIGLLCTCSVSETVFLAGQCRMPGRSGSLGLPSRSRLIGSEGQTRSMSLTPPGVQ